MSIDEFFEFLEFLFNSNISWLDVSCWSDVSCHLTIDKSIRRSTKNVKDFLFLQILAFGRWVNAQHSDIGFLFDQKKFQNAERVKGIEVYFKKLRLKCVCVAWVEIKKNVESKKN